MSGLLTGLACILTLALVLAYRHIYSLQRERFETFAKVAADKMVNREVARAFRDAADDWDDPRMADDLRTLARQHYQAGGPSMPAIWMRLRADALEVHDG